MATPAPKDYSKTDDIQKGALMALKAFGIKEEVEQQKYMRKLNEAKLAMQVRQDEREVKAADVALKVAQANQIKIETETALKQIEMQQKQEEMMGKRLAMARTQDILSGKPATGEHGGVMQTPTQDPEELFNRLLQVQAPTMQGKDILKAAEGLRPKEQTEGERVFQLKIRETMNSLKVDRPTATGLVLGYQKINTNPLTGESVIVDITTGRSRPIKSMGKPKQEEAPKETDINLYRATDKGTGLYSTIMNAVSVSSGFVGGPIAKEHIQARQELNMAQRSLYRALRESSKVLAFEMQSIFKEHPIDPSIIRSPAIAKANMEVIDKFMIQRIKDYEEIANNTSLPMEDRKNAGSSVTSMKHFRNILGIPQTGPQPGDIEDGYKFLGGDPMSPYSWEKIE